MKSVMTEFLLWVIPGAKVHVVRLGLTKKMSIEPQATDTEGTYTLNGIPGSREIKAGEAR
jgi:hypothetical protein